MKQVVAIFASTVFRKIKIQSVYRLELGPKSTAKTCLSDFLRQSKRLEPSLKFKNREMLPVSFLRNYSNILPQL